jgi:hypothetical protein
MEVVARIHQPPGLFSWWREADSRAQRACLAASFGWMLDAFDVMLFALVLVPLMRDLNLTPAEGGALNSITLLAAARASCSSCKSACGSVT